MNDYSHFQSDFYEHNFQSEIISSNEDYHYDTRLLSVLKAIAFGAAWIATAIIECHKIEQNKEKTE